MISACISSIHIWGLLEGKVSIQLLWELSCKFRSHLKMPSYLTQKFDSTLLYLAEYKKTPILFCHDKKQHCCNSVINYTNRTGIQTICNSFMDPAVLAATSISDCFCEQTAETKRPSSSSAKLNLWEVIGIENDLWYANTCRKQIGLNSCSFPDIPYR